MKESAFALSCFSVGDVSPIHFPANAILNSSVQRYSLMHISQVAFISSLVAQHLTAIVSSKYLCGVLTQNLSCIYMKECSLIMLCFYF